VNSSFVITRIAPVFLAMALAQNALAETLTVYSAMEPDQVREYTDAFEKANPDIKLEIIRASTGIMAARIFAERETPRADVIWRLSNFHLIRMGKLDMLEAYMPKNGEKLAQPFIDSANPPMWVGQDGYIGAICFNTVEAKKKNLPKPASWKDLTNPIYRGQIVMPNPNASGTGLIMVSSWLQTFGAAAGWKYMDDLNKNIAQYIPSGSKPCQLAATGEYPIGLSVSFRAAVLKAQGAPIDLIFAKEGAGWDLEGAAILKGTKKLAAAKRFMDWSISEDALLMYSAEYAVLPRDVPGAKIPPFHPASISSVLIKNDFGWLAANYQSFLAEWNSRYESKAAK
jgi:iron(III) transport system substrate-binding protein